MLLHGEQYWLMGYVAAVLGGTLIFYKKGMRASRAVPLALLGITAAFYGWLFQVGRFG